MRNLRFCVAFLASLAIANLVACNTASFSGTGKKTTVQNQAPATAKPSPTPSVVASQIVPAPTAVPGAITKGSFTVWTVPDNPEPRQNYKIYIQVKLPSNTTSYLRSDLTGSVNGTDNYFRDIGREVKDFLYGDIFTFEGTTATLVLSIPGAETLVKDSIRVHSQLLNEEQDIAIVF